MSLKRMLEGILLTPDQSIEVDQVVFECDLMFGLEIPAVERRIVRTEAVVDGFRIESFGHLAYRSEVRECAGVHVGAWTEFKTDPAMPHLWQQVRQVKRNLDAVSDAAQIWK